MTKGKKRQPQPSPGPSTKVLRTAPQDVEAMAVDPPASTGRDFPDNALSAIAKNLQKLLVVKNWKDDGTDTSFDSVIPEVFVAVAGARQFIDGCPESFLYSLERITENVNAVKKSDPGFIDSLRQAVNGNDAKLWGPVLKHDVFHTVIPDSGLVSELTFPPKMQEQAVARSWLSPFAGEHVLEALAKHVVEERRKEGTYAPFCSIVQSSGMGKSRLVDEFSKTNFLIPINLRRAEGQRRTTMASVGTKRLNFYKQIVDDVETRMNAKKRVLTGDVKRALKMLLSCLNGAQIDPEDENASANAKNGKLPDVFIAFDEAHSLAQPIEKVESKERKKWTFFIEQISQFAMPGEIDHSARMHDKELRSPLPFSDLGFDHLMRDRKVFDTFKTIDDVTSTDCVVHMGRPLWGTIYDSSEDLNRETLLDFAILKLLCGRDNRSGNISLSIDQQCGVLSQRLALDINSSAYITSGSTRNYVMADKAQLQIANYMRVCIGIPEDLVSVRGVAASEPILSEAASRIMWGNYKFNLPDALLNVVDSYAISHGDRGELLVAALFTRARDLYVRRIPPEKLFPTVLTQICPIFSDVLTRSCLLAMMARGAAAYGANGQFGFDMVYPFLYGTSDLDVEQVGFIIIQVKNHANRLAPNAKLFKKMDPFLCDLLSEEDTDFTVPIIRIVFALGGGKSSFTRQTYGSPDDGAVTFDEQGRPQFTSYDFWCSGIGPNLLRPVDEDHGQKKWETLLGKTDKWDHTFSASMAPDVRRSQYPAGGSDDGHYRGWLDTSAD
ncbi:hypothetical protein EDB85DRAFT_1896484 [Lactarius pseudohatsudake]|nr:hypothetical protein EDB85DRAFT_1896484 [Lactarius pseudohatsudake]